MVIKLCAYTSPKYSRKALLFDYGEFEQGGLKNKETTEAIKKNIELWSDEGRMALFDTLGSPTYIHVYLDETPPTRWPADTFVKPIQSWISFRTGKVTCLAMPDFLQWTSGEAASTPPLEFTGEIPPGTYLAEFSLVLPETSEINAAIDAKIGARQHRWLEKFENLSAISTCLSMGLAGCFGFPSLGVGIAAFWYPFLWAVLVIGVLAVAIPLLVSITVLSSRYFKKLGEERDLVLTDFPDYCVVLRAAPPDFDPSTMLPPKYDGDYRVHESEQTYQRERQEWKDKVRRKS